MKQARNLLRPLLISVLLLTPVLGFEIAYYTTFYNDTKVSIELRADLYKNTRPFVLLPGEHVTFRGGLSTANFIIQMARRQLLYRLPITRDFPNQNTGYYRGQKNYAYVLAPDLKIYRATADGAVDHRPHEGFPLTPRE